MKQSDIKKIISYWLSSAEEDWRFVRRAFEIKQYSHALFFGHLVLEKALKALIVKVSKEHALPTHNLIDLAKKADIHLSEQMEDDFLEITTFNIGTRYPEERFKIHQKTKHREYAMRYFQLIERYYLWLKKEVSKKK